MHRPCAAWECHNITQRKESRLCFIIIISMWIINIQGRIYYEANEASASGPHHLGGPHQNFNAVSKVDTFKKSL